MFRHQTEPRGGGQPEPSDDEARGEAESRQVHQKILSPLGDGIFCTAVLFSMHCMSRVAVVIPAKNEAEYVPRLLRALQRQTRQPDEVVVADAGSTDGTVERAEALGARVVQGGVAAVGRNNGAAATTAETIIFFDADAIIDDTQFIENAVREFAARKLDVATADVVVEGGTRSDRVSMVLYNFYVRLWGRRHPHPIGTFMMARRSMHERIHGFDPTVTFAEDHDYGLRVRNAGGTFGVLNTVRVAITPRRQEKIGRLRFLLVNILAEPYIMFIGPIRSTAFARQYEKHKA